MAKGKYHEWLTPEGLVKLEGWARDGLTDEQIATNIGISRSTLNKWKNDFPDISDTLKRGKEVVDRQVENALFKRALGYEYTERTAKVVDREPAIVEAERREFENRFKLDNPEASSQEIKDAAVKAIPTRERIVFLEVDKQVAPDTGAIAFWLKNRKPDTWRDKKEMELSGGIDVGSASDKLREELRKRRERDG